MFKEAISTLSACLLLFSCSGNSDSDKANALLAEAEQACETGRYELAVTLCDSLKTAYPQEIEARRKSLHIMSLANEGMAVKRLEKADSILAVTGVRGDSLKRLLRWVNNPVEGYYVAQNEPSGTVSATDGLHARVTPEGDFYIISSLKAPAVKSTSVTVSCGGEQASTSTVAYDGERNDRSMGAEVITFLGVECEELGKFVASHADLPVTLTFSGDKSHSISLPKQQAEAIRTLYEYAATVRDAKVAMVEKSKLERTVETARSQAARTFVETDTLK